MRLGTAVPNALGAGVTYATQAAGVVGGAAAGAAAGALRGTATGLARGASAGAASTPAAALGIAALGITGLVDWPILLAGGTTALVIRQLRAASPEGRTPLSRRPVDDL